MSEFRSFVDAYYQINEVYNLAVIAVRRILINKLLSKLSASKTFKSKDMFDTINSFGQRVSDLNSSEISALKTNIRTVIADLITAGKIKQISPGEWRVISPIPAEDSGHEDNSKKLNDNVLEFMNKRLRKAMTSPEFTKDDIIAYIDVNNVFDFRPDDLPEISTILDKLLKNAVNKKLLELTGDKYKFKRTVLGAKATKFVLEEFLPSKAIGDAFSDSDVSALAIGKLNPSNVTEESDISGNVTDTLNDEVTNGNLELLPSGKFKIKKAYVKSNAKEKIYEFLKTLAVGDTFDRRKLIDSIDDAPDDDDIDDILQQEINDGRLKLVGVSYMVMAPFTDRPRARDIDSVIRYTVIEYINSVGKNNKFTAKMLQDYLAVKLSQYHIQRQKIEEKTKLVLDAAKKEKIIKRTSSFRNTTFIVLKESKPEEWKRLKAFANIGLGSIGIEYVGFEKSDKRRVFDIENLRTVVEKKSFKYAKDFFNTKSINDEFKPIDLISFIESAERFSPQQVQEIKQVVDDMLAQLVEHGDLLETGKNTANHKYRIKQNIVF